MARSLAMNNTAIDYKSIIMRCDSIQKAAHCEIDNNLEFEYYDQDMDKVWIDIQKFVGAFENHTDKDIQLYFNSKFLSESDKLTKRCVFLKDTNTNIYVGTCCAWFGKKDDSVIPVLHWLAVRKGFENKKYARMLISKTLDIFNQLDYGKAIYLHTQPDSYKAIKLYNDFGFCLSKSDTLGNSSNDYLDALTLLEHNMDCVSFKRIIMSLVD